MRPAIRTDSTARGWGRTLVLCGLLSSAPGYARVEDPSFVPSPRTMFPSLIAGATPQPAASVELVVRVDVEGVVQSVTAPAGTEPAHAAAATAAARAARFVPAVSDGVRREASVRLHMATLADGRVVPVPPGRARDPRRSGSMPMEDIRQGIRAHRAEYLACHEAELRADPTNVAGVVTLHFRIDNDGRVGAALVLPADLGERPALARCMLDAVMTWRFPTVTGAGIVLVVYPFRFLTTP